jgi:carbon storage regulator
MTAPVAPLQLFGSAVPRKEHLAVLVLTRRPQQSIMIGDDIVVTVPEVKGDQIRLGVSAPRLVEVFREEVLVARQQADKSAALEPGLLPEPREAPDAASPAPAAPRPRAVPKPPLVRPPGSRPAA